MKTALMSSLTKVMLSLNGVLFSLTKVIFFQCKMSDIQHNQSDIQSNWSDIQPNQSADLHSVCDLTWIILFMVSRALVAKAWECRFKITWIGCCVHSHHKRQISTSAVERVGQGFVVSFNQFYVGKDALKGKGKVGWRESEHFVLQG